jgi:surfeit locus 1 family protein
MPVSARGRGVLSAAMATGVGIAMLVTLGVWQVQRLHWKQAILADIDRAETSAPAPLVGVPPRFAKVVADGVLRPQVALYGAFVRTATDGSARMGADRMQVLDRPAGPVLVDMGWVPTEGAVPPAASGPVRITGYARMPERPHWYSPDDNAGARLFYTLDPHAIGAALGAPAVAPFTLVALGKVTDTPPIPATELPRPPNNHLQYALTWFGLAAALAGVFGVWVVKGKE